MANLTNSYAPLFLTAEVKVNLKLKSTPATKRLFALLVCPTQLSKILHRMTFRLLTVQTNILVKVNMCRR